MVKDKHEDKSCLDELKKNYKELQEKYSLPSFDFLNREFQIEKVAECETDYLVREIRKIVAEKFSNYLRFIEIVLNPMNAPMFVFSIIKTLGTEEKKKLSEIYKELAKFEVTLIRLDADFSEEREAEFINNSYKIWQKIKKEVLDIVEVVEKNWDNKIESNGGRYFG